MLLENNALLLGSADVMQVLGCSKSSAEKCIRFINNQERKNGRFIIRGKVNRYAFFEFCGIPYDKTGLLQ